MANKRMFNLSVIDTDAFLEMPLSTQALYFHLNMRADDDGFVGSPKIICRTVGASEDDLKLLIAKRFIILFEDGVIVIKHWRMHNTLSVNRYKETNYTEDKALLKIKQNKAYTLDDGQPLNDKKYIEIGNRQTKDEQKTNNRRTIDEQKTNTDKIRIDKISIDKNSIDKNSIGEMQEGDKAPKSKAKRFTPPTLEEVQAYCIERNNSVDAERFINYYTSNGWQVGKNKMKDWKAAVRTWERNGYSNNNKPTNQTVQELDSFYKLAATWAESEED